MKVTFKVDSCMGHQEPQKHKCDSSVTTRKLCNTSLPRWHQEAKSPTLLSSWDPLALSFQVSESSWLLIPNWSPSHPALPAWPIQPRGAKGPLLGTGQESSMLHMLVGTPRPCRASLEYPTLKLNGLSCRPSSES